MRKPKRGRVSMAELMIPGRGAKVIQRPDAPYELDDEEAAEWRAQVAAMPADHFTRSTFPLLVQLCRHVVAANRLKQLEMKILKPGKGKQFDMRAYTDIRKTHSIETSAINRLLRAMRLTQQSTIKAETMGRRLASFQTIDGDASPPWSGADDYADYSKSEIGDDEE